ncbi:MAG TPA: M13-type metalloendopeptidase, partial [Elusimicrobiales bacterium]|nr:M13-type metalloendopeptidase [Elusimicrobiales bacterium]
YTRDQRFFLSYAQVWCGNDTEKAKLAQIQSDPHPVHDFRTNGQLSTMAEFQQAFGCKKGDPMSAAVGLRAW